MPPRAGWARRRNVEAKAKVRCRPVGAVAAGRLRPGVDGVYLEYAGHAATFLPQVWESLPDPVDFLEALRHKARLPSRFWDPAIRLTRYTVEKYGDGRPAH